MTERIYYTDPMLRAFEATVVACDVVDGRACVVLDRTAFYPTSGGQPFDTGRLGAAAVIEVAVGPDEAVVHVASAPLAPGTRIEGEIDWARRFDHMQQHTGQHVLSAIFDRRVSAATVSFHMGAETATIDLSRTVTPAEIEAVEAEANSVIWEDRPVRVRVVSDDEARRLPLRREPARTGDLRLVEIADCDLSACGGTHVPATGMVGMVGVTGWERLKGGTRVTFVCGGRALRSHGTLRDVVTAATRVLSLTPSELASGIERAQRDLKEFSKTARGLQDELAQYRAVALREMAETIGPYRVVLRAEPASDASVLKTLASAVASASGLVVVLVGTGQPAPVVVVRSADVDLDAGSLIREITVTHGGRGGGRPEAAQAGVPVPPVEILEFVRGVIARR